MSNSGQFGYVEETAFRKMGTKLEPGTAIETWEEQVFPWKLRTTPALYCPNGGEYPDASILTSQTAEPVRIHKYADRRVIYRDDTGEPMAVVSDRYKVTQPRDVLRFFSELVSDQGFEMEIAGSVRGGRVYWALAKTGQVASIKGDEHRAYTMLASSCDGSLANLGRFTDFRMKCTNMLTMMIRQRDGGAVHRSKHSSEFNPDDFKRALNLIDFEASWFAHTEQLRKLAETPVTPMQAANFVLEVTKDVKGAQALAKVVTERNREIPRNDSGGIGYSLARSSGELDKLKADIAATMAAMSTGYEANAAVQAGNHASKKLWGVLQRGQGQRTEAAKGTAYGCLQAATRWLDHERKARSDASRMATSWFGDGEAKKAKALEIVNQYAEAA